MPAVPTDLQTRLDSFPSATPETSAMYTVILLLTAVAIQAPPPHVATEDIARWQRQARGVTIVRDDWGIAHVHGKTDADAVFGMEYAQAEDDFNRVETNYL